MGIWRVIYIAPSARLAQAVLDRLTAEGFFVRVREAAVGDGLGGAFEVLVPSSEVEEAHEAVNRFLAAGFLAAGDGLGEP